MIQPRTNREQEIVDEIIDEALPPNQRTQPRTARERRIAKEAVRDADQIRAARANCRNRVILISPNYSQAQKRAALKRLQAEQEGGAW